MRKTRTSAKVPDAENAENAGSPCLLPFRWKTMTDLLGDALPLERKNNRPEAAEISTAEKERKWN